MADDSARCVAQEPIGGCDPVPCRCARRHDPQCDSDDVVHQCWECGMTWPAVPCAAGHTHACDQHLRPEEWKPTDLLKHHCACGVTWWTTTEEPTGPIVMPPNMDEAALLEKLREAQTSSSRMAPLLVTVPQSGEHEQPLPTAGAEDVQSALIEHIRQRRNIGITRYGTALQTFNGRDGLRDALEEALDLATYLMQVRMEVEEQARMLDKAGKLLMTAESMDLDALEEAQWQQDVADWTSWWRDRWHAMLKRGDQG